MATTKKKVIWSGTKPERCDICKRLLVQSGVFIDGKTQFGPWAMMCSWCHADHGGKFGLGLGQKYELEAPGFDVWVKVEG